MNTCPLPHQNSWIKVPWRRYYTHCSGAPFQGSNSILEHISKPGVRAQDPTTRMEEYNLRERSSPRFVVVSEDNAGREANLIDVETAYSREGMFATVSVSS
jgi:hypothetical protein